MKFPLFVCVFFPLFLFFTATLGRISASFGTVATSGGAFGSRKLKSKPDEQREGIEEPVQNKILYICTHVYNISYIYIYIYIVCMYIYIYMLSTKVYKGLVSLEGGAWLLFGDTQIVNIQRKPAMQFMHLMR